MEKLHFIGACGEGREPVVAGRLKFRAAVGQMRG